MTMNFRGDGPDCEVFKEDPTFRPTSRLLVVSPSGNKELLGLDLGTGVKEFVAGFRIGDDAGDRCELACRDT
jgi:hypothetical protein